MMKIAVAQAAPPQIQSPMARPQEKAFAAETAAVTGESKSQINRHIARAEALGDDLDKVAGTSLLAKVSVRALRKLQVRAARAAGFSPSWGRTAAVPFLGELRPPSPFWAK